MCIWTQPTWIRRSVGSHLDEAMTFILHQYTFPPQPLVISACAELAKTLVSGELIGAPDTNGKRNSTMDAWIVPTERTEEDSRMKQDKEKMLVVVG